LCISFIFFLKCDLSHAKEYLFLKEWRTSWKLGAENLWGFAQDITASVLFQRMSFSTLDEVARVEKPLLRRQDEKSTQIGRLFNLPIFALCLLNPYYILHLFTVFALTEKRSADDVNFLSGR